MIVGAGFGGLAAAIAAVATELRKPAVTLLLVWQEYRDQHPGGYSYSQFRRHYREYMHLATPEPRMRRTLLPAEMCQVDYAGMTMPVATADGERQASIFVGTLGKGPAPRWMKPYLAKG